MLLGWVHVYVTQAVFFIGCLSWPSCPAHLNNIGWTTKATQGADEEISSTTFFMIAIACSLLCLSVHHTVANQAVIDMI